MFAQSVRMGVAGALRWKHCGALATRFYKDSPISREQIYGELRKSGVVVVMNPKHVTTAKHLVTTMWEVYQAGFVAEATMRINLEIIKEAMPELRRLRQQEFEHDRYFVLGVGSIINNEELAQAQELGFDMLVGPANMVGAGYSPAYWLGKAQKQGFFVAPGVFTPTELQSFLEDLNFSPDAIKIFPADSHGPAGIKGLLAPFKRKRHAGRIIMPTGGVNCETGPKYLEAISATGFAPILGMSAPLELVEKENAPGNAEVIRRSLRAFKTTFLQKMASLSGR